MIRPTHSTALGGTLAALLALGAAAGTATPASAAAVMRGTVPVRAETPSQTMAVSVGRGTLVTLPSPMTDIFVADEKVADVQVRSPTQLWVFGRGPGETSVYATTRSGQVIWSRQVQVAQNIESVGEMLKVALPDAAVTVTPMNGLVLLTGTVANPDDVAEATRLTQAIVGEKMQVLTKLRTATSLQVALHVKIAEVSRSVSKAIGVNLMSVDGSGGFKFGIGQAGKTIPQFVPGGPLGVGVTGGPQSATLVPSVAGGTTLGLAGKLLGMDLLSSIDLAENNGMATTLAEPNLVALSGETASFLAGGEIPVPQSEGLGSVSVAFKQYGVSLAFTPVVLSGGRISLRVRPEVSQLSDSGSVRLNGFTIPSLTTRRAETTVELGSGQSFVIGGLLQNTHNNSTDKAPFLGDIPILGALFRSNSFRKQETELMIVVTPYLVRPVDQSAIRLPTDGYKAATDAERVLLNGLPVSATAGAAPPAPALAPSTPPAPTPQPAPAQ